MFTAIVSPKASHLPGIDLTRLQRRLGRIVCSAPWFDVCRAEFIAVRLKDLQRPENALDRAGVYPPGGRPRAGRRGTIMRRCIGCATRWQPPYYLLSSGLCEDCVAAIDAPPTDESNHISSTSSPSAKVFAELAHYQVRLIETRLPQEDEASLRREIAAHLANGTHGSFASVKNTKKHV